jgi:hypothetical protein
MSPDPAEGLSVEETEDLLAVLDDEYRAHATYTQILDDLGPVLPFTNIRDAEARHVDALLGLLRAFGVAAPSNTWPGRVTRYPSVQEACAAGVRAEIDNAALYDRVLTRTSRPELVTVYENLQRASRENHLPAFERCAGTQSGREPGRGRGRRLRARRGRR